MAWRTRLRTGSCPAAPGSEPARRRGAGPRRTSATVMHTARGCHDGGHADPASPPDPPVRQAAERPLRRARPHPGGGAADGGRGPPDHEAEHRQPGPVRLRGAGRRPGGDAPAPAARAGLLGLQGHLLGAHRRLAVLRVPGHPGHRRGRRVHRQRRLRDDHDGPHGPGRRRRRDPRPLARLPAVDRRHHPGRGPGGALPLRRGGGLGARPRAHRVPRHGAHQGHRPDQPEQPHRRGLLPRRAAGHRGRRPPPQPRPHGGRACPTTCSP